MRLLPTVRANIEINGVVVYTSTGVDSCSSRHFARSRSRQSSPLKLLVCHSFAHFLGNALQLLGQELFVSSSLDWSQLVRTSSSCVSQRILWYPLIARVLQAYVSAHDTNSPSSLMSALYSMHDFGLHSPLWKNLYSLRLITLGHSGDTCICHR